MSENEAPLSPSPALLCKLASVVVHGDELFGPDGRVLDKAVFLQALADPEVKQWIAAMTKLGMAPVKRLPPKAEKALREIKELR